MSVCENDLTAHKQMRIDAETREGEGRAGSAHGSVHVEAGKELGISCN